MTASRRATPRSLVITVDRKAPTKTKIVASAKRVLLVRPVSLISIWSLLIAAAVVSVVAGKGSVLFLPIIVLPLKGLLVGVWALLNRSRFTIDKKRLDFVRGPIPPTKRVTIHTRDVRRVVVRELTPRMGGYFTTGVVFDWTLKALMHTDESVELPVLLPSREEAEALADSVNEALDRFRKPSSYRDG